VAHHYVDHIEAAPGAPEGEVIRMGNKWDLTVFNAEDLVVCRTTKPLVELAYRCLKARVPVRITGKEIGAGLKTLIAKMKASNLDELTLKIEDWACREVDKAIAKQLDGKAAAIQDKCDAVLCLVNSMDEDSRTIGDLYKVIDALFDNPSKCLTLATIHKAKGLEADTVFWLNSEKPTKWAKQPWQKQQETNLKYVAVTRAKTKLVFINDGSK
jgi:hypothetical protein